MIKYKIGNVVTDVNQWKFPDSTVGVNINQYSHFMSNEIDAILITMIFGDDGFSINDDIMALVNTVDALKRHYHGVPLHLVMPYVPYARQDRACNPGDSASLFAFGAVLNTLGFETVRVIDPHSTVMDACIHNMIVIPQVDVFRNIYPSWKDIVIVAPDQGALKKCEEFASFVGADSVISCTKKRDMKTGAITGLRVLDTVHLDKRFLVLDDIVDGGRTFIEVANEIRSVRCGRGLVIDLAVTHGLFTKGVDIVANQFNRVYTTNSIKTDKDHPKVTLIEIF